jgi:L-seryl-tRNA(Ser) seleniumtransferase
VEIGGSFRVPDVMAASGARLREEGTTNKTRLLDYEQALGPETGLLLKVHRSNFELVGFTEETSIGELASVAREASLPLVMDMGSGTLLEELPAAFGEVPTVRGLLGQGVDLLCFSGDKMLGGPQSGILLGRTRWIQRLAKDPMARALRVGKLTLAALYATLECYRNGREGMRSVPVVDMLLEEAEPLRRRAERLANLLREEVAGLGIEIVETQGQVGGGAMPLCKLPGFGVALTPAGGDAKGLADRLRTGEPPVVGRLHQDRLVLDVRTLLGVEEERAVAAAVRAAVED